MRRYVIVHMINKDQHQERKLLDSNDIEKARNWKRKGQAIWINTEVRIWDRIGKTYVD